jgi:hypothetical protein
LTVLKAGDRAAAGFTALTFTGGCLATAIFLAPWLWRARTLLALAGGVAVAAFALFSEGTLLHAYGWIHGWPRFSMEAQIIFWTAGGVSVAALAVADVWKRRDARSWLLALWIMGTFVFTAGFNWSVNGRSILPMAPVVGILLARRLQQRAGANEKNPAVGRRGILMALAAGALFAFLVALSDFLFAAAARQSAVQTSGRHGQAGHTLWFEGHWGFQYYLEKLGGQALDMRHPGLRDGDVLAVPLNNTNLNPPPAPSGAFYVSGPRFLADMNLYIGAGFYSSSDGPLPFVLGHVPPENIIIHVWKTGPANDK